MVYDYNKLYGETPEALGAPTKIFVDFFKDLGPEPGTVLDVGCGQGRDALFIARLGHKVTGVDYAPNGIKDLIEAAKAENLNITGIVADITEYTADSQFDVVLIDRTLHMLDKAPRLKALTALMSSVVTGGWLLIADEKSNIPDFVSALETSPQNWRIEHQNRGYLFAQLQ